MDNAPTPTSPGQYVSVNDLHIYYETYGAGPPLLLIHGGMADLQSWAPHVPALSQHFRVIAFDSRGHGHTTNPADRLSYRLLADDTAALIQTLQLDHPCICGYSDGGQIGLELAIRYPGLARAYVIGAAAQHWPPAYGNILTYFGMDAPGRVNLAYVRDCLPDLVAALQPLDAIHGDGYWQTYLRHLSMLWVPPLPFADADMQRIQDPTLLVIGDRDDIVLPVEQAVALYRLIPHAELAILPGADHLLPETHAALFTQVVIDFLRRQ